MGPEHPVFDQRGRTIGTVRQVRLGRHRKKFWDARSLDGCDLGAHVNRIEAEEAIQDDWDAGRPRSAKNKRDRWRPIQDSTAPVFLGH